MYPTKPNVSGWAQQTFVGNSVLSWNSNSKFLKK